MSDLSTPRSRDRVEEENNESRAMEVDELLVCVYSPASDYSRVDANRRGVNNRNSRAYRYYANKNKCTGSSTRNQCVRCVQRVQSARFSQRSMRSSFFVVIKD